jgi:hypothetical protein
MLQCLGWRAEVLRGKLDLDLRPHGAVGQRNPFRSLPSCVGARGIPAPKTGLYFVSALAR